MPIIDEERDMLVLRIVYDGAPLSGKTTTLRTLAKSLGAAMTTPEEHNGRTLFFDWVDYTGGLFDGRQIRCQIVSVPGQTELAERRRVIVESADALVLVMDTRKPEFDAGIGVLRGLLGWCGAQDPPVGVVVQANKRDADDAVPQTQLRERIGDAAPTTATVETVATAGEGVREAFVFAVRLALDRVRALVDRGLLSKGRPVVASPENLMSVLEDVQVDEIDWQADSKPTQAVSKPKENVDSAPRPPRLRMQVIRAPKTTPKLPEPTSPAPSTPGSAEVIFVPDPLMPGGFIWPPVDGRALLYEVGKLHLVPSRGSSGDWSACGGGWRFHSASGWLFPDSGTGRRALIEQARFHSAHLKQLSVGRALLLADAGHGQHRLWQLIRVHPSMRERLFESVHSMSAAGCAEALVNAASHLLLARGAFRSTRMPLPCTLWTVGDDQPTYVGVAKLDATPSEDIEGDDLLKREFGPLLRAIKAERDDFADVLWALERMPVPSSVAALVTNLRG